MKTHMIREVLGKIAEEIGARPIAYGAEVLQFVLLVFLVRALALGFGKHKGLIVKMLEERRGRIAESLSRAEAAEGSLKLAEDRAGAIVSEARTQAARILKEARRKAAEETQAARQTVDEEAASMKRRAEEILAAEMAEMNAEVREQLVDVVAGATRSILNESLSPSEQRDLIQHAILDGMANLEHGPTGRRRGGTRRASRTQAAEGGAAK